MDNNLLYYIEKPFLKKKGGIIIDANEAFLNLTQFDKNELCEKCISDILDKLFRSTNKVIITKEKIDTILFTKTFDVRFVKIKKYSNLYIFNEIENS